MSREPAGIRLLSAIVAGAFIVSGCVTTYSVPSRTLGTVAGLPEDRETELSTGQGSSQRVKGSTRFTLLSDEGTPALWTPSLNSPDGGSNTATEVPLSSLRIRCPSDPLPQCQGGALVLSETGQSIALDRTGGLVGGILVGALIVALVAALVASLHAVTL
jgi:hypothetical protein